MKIIYDDIIYSLQRSGGISQYWQKLEESISVDTVLRYFGCDKNICYTTHPGAVFNSRKIFFERYKTIHLHENEQFIFHSSYYRYCSNKNAVNITTLHDFTYELFRSDLFATAHKLQKKRAVFHSDGIICISENTLNDFKRYYPHYRGLVKVIHHGYDNNVFVFDKTVKRTNDVVFIGSRAQYKNFAFGIRLLKEIPELHLVIVGGGDLSPEELSVLESNLSGRYTKKSYVSDFELAKIYNMSFALMYPSSYEGFGFPIIEAQACGCPVICQRVSSIPEVSGDNCIYIDDKDLISSIKEIKKLLDAKFYTAMQNAALENVKLFSWTKMISETENFYKDVFYSRGKQ